MATWHDLSFNFEQVLKSSDMNNIDENFDALAEQASGAPNLQVRDGTASSPGLPFRDDADTGVLRPGANLIAFSVGGSEALRIDSNGIATTDSVDGNAIAANSVGDSELDNSSDLNASIAELSFANKESTSSNDGQVVFDSSEGMLIHHTQQPGDASTTQDYVVLDGANISAGNGMSISGGGGAGGAPVTFAASGVSRSEMSMSTGSQSSTIDNGNRVTITLNDGALFPGIEHDAAVQDIRMLSDESGGSANASASSPKFVLENNSGSDNITVDVAWRYINA